MQLTSQQIATINKTLVLNGLVYDDIKLEVLDHIASEIEALQEVNSLSFDENFKTIFKKWKKDLRPMTYGLLLGNHFSGPKIAMDKIADATKSEIKWVAILTFFITLSIVFCYDLSKNVDFIRWIEMTIKSICFTVGALSILGRIILLSSKIKTSYAVLFRKRLFFTLFYPLNLIIRYSSEGFLHKDLGVKIVMIVFAVSFTLFLLNNFRRLISHFQFEKKLIISNS